jgi:hypothetical protein
MTGAIYADIEYHSKQAVKAQKGQRPQNPPG